MRLATDLWKSTRVTRTTRKVRASVVHVRASRPGQKVEAQAPSTTWRLSFATTGSPFQPGLLHATVLAASCTYWDLGRSSYRIESGRGKKIIERVGRFLG